MKDLLSAIQGIGAYQYLGISVHKLLSGFDVYNIRVWNHGAYFKGIAHHRDGKQVIHRIPLKLPDMVSIIEYLGVFAENSTFRYTDEPWEFMRDLNKEWYFTLNPREDVEPIELFGSHLACQSQCPSHAEPEGTLTLGALGRSLCVCPLCHHQLTPERSAQVLGSVEAQLRDVAPA